MCVLPVPGGPSRITFCLRVQEVELAEVLDHLLLDRALEGEVKLLQGLVGGNRAERIRHRPPEDSREESSVESKASANRS